MNRAPTQVKRASRLTCYSFTRVSVSDSLVPGLVSVRWSPSSVNAPGWA